MAGIVAGTLIPVAIQALAKLFGGKRGAKSKDLIRQLTQFENNQHRRLGGANQTWNFQKKASKTKKRKTKKKSSKVPKVRKSKTGRRKLKRKLV